MLKWRKIHIKEARKGLVRNTKSQAYVIIYALSQSTRSYWCLKLEHRNQKIALKIALIDTTNSTNINKYKEKISLYDLALNIKSIENFDTRVKNGDLSLVSELAFKNQKINLFSFATKYCCYHNVCAYDNDDYFIFDNILKKHLHLYIPTATKNKLENLRSHRDYETYHKLLSDYLLENNINCEFKRRKFDHFVWNQFRKKS